MTAKRLILNGYYGFDNFGDELILISLIRLFRRYGYELTVLSASPAVTRQRYGVGAVHRYNPFQVFVSLLRSHAFISGGGGLLQDSTGPNSAIYYAGMMLLARLFGLKVLHAFTSVGPLVEASSRTLTSWGLKACDFIIVRDEKSATEVENLTGVRPLVAADAVWLLPPLGVSKLPNPMLGEGGTLWKVGLSLRPHSRFSVADEQALVHHLSDVLERAAQGLQVEVSLISCEDAMDLPVLEGVEEQLRLSLSASAREKITFKLISQSSAWATLAKMHWVIGMRYHALVSALLNKVPAYALDYDPKVEMLAKDLRLPSTPVDALIRATSHDFLQGLEAYQAPDLTPLIQSVESAFSALRIVLESEHQRH